VTAKNTALVSALVASILNLPEGTVSADASMESVSKWDSLAHLNICLAFEERFGVVLDMETIASSTSVAKLVTLIPN
jgi:acyl carrier protein